MNNLSIYCITNKRLHFLEDFNYNLAWVGTENPPSNYLTCNDKINIFFKEKHYSELTFQYWYWKNLLSLEKNEWIGFCQKRRFWIKSEAKSKDINISNYKEYFLTEPYQEWNEYESIICEPISISGAKKIKILKRGWKNLIKDPLILFDKKKENLALHFDMHHGFGNLDIAIEQINDQDKKEFREFLYERSSFNPHIMFIAKKKTIDQWFNVLFPWLERCEKKFGFNRLKGYDTTRLYAYLSERYLSFWFKKYTKYLERPWIFLDSEKE